MMLRIGNFQPETNLLLAPISGYCDLAFRLTIRPLGGLGLACTDLIHPKGIIRATFRTRDLVRTHDNDRPLCLQLYGRDPAPMAEAARWAQDAGFAVVDINLGCPARKIIKKQAGAALLREPEVAVKLAAKVVQAVDIPVTAKIRLGWDDGHIVAPQLAAALEDVGVAGVIVHGRTADQKFAGSVRLAEIARVVAAVKQIPVIGNGDICCPQDARTMIEQTGCAGVMIGRQALKDPWIFRDTHACLTTGTLPDPPTRGQRIALMNAHFERLLQLDGRRRAILNFRQRISWYVSKIKACRAFREQVRLIRTPDEYYRLVRVYLTPEAERIEI